MFHQHFAHIFEPKYNLRPRVVQFPPQKCLAYQIHYKRYRVCTV